MLEMRGEAGRSIKLGELGEREGGRKREEFRKSGKE
jgi:hypothetical protein